MRQRLTVRPGITILAAAGRPSASSANSNITSFMLLKIMTGKGLPPHGGCWGGPPPGRRRGPPGPPGPRDSCIDGSPPSPRSISASWRRFRARGRTCPIGRSRARFVVVQLHLGPGADRHGFDARPLGQGPGSRLGIGHHSWPQPTRPPLRRRKATAQRHVGPEGRLVYTSADRDGQNGNSGWNVLTGGSHVVQESAPSRTQMSTTHAWRFRRLRARVSLVIPW